MHKLFVDACEHSEMICCQRKVWASLDGESREWQGYLSDASAPSPPLAFLHSAYLNMLPRAMSAHKST